MYLGYYGYGACVYDIWELGDTNWVCLIGGIILVRFVTCMVFDVNPLTGFDEKYSKTGVNPTGWNCLG